MAVDDILTTLRRLLMGGQHSSAALLFVGRAPADAPPILEVMRWRAPSGRYVAQLTLPRDMPKDEHLDLEFFDEHGRPAKDMTGQPVVINGYVTTVDKKGRARLNVKDLRTTLQDTPGPLVLRVGPQQSEWDATD